MCVRVCLFCATSRNLELSTFRQLNQWVCRLVLTEFDQKLAFLETFGNNKNYTANSGYTGNLLYSFCYIHITLRSRYTPIIGVHYPYFNSIAIKLWPVAWNRRPDARKQMQAELKVYLNCISLRAYLIYKVPIGIHFFRHLARMV